MSDETERAKEIDEAVKAADAKRRADAEAEVHNGEKLDNILKYLDSLSARLDEYNAKRKDEDDPTTNTPFLPPIGDGEIEERGKPRELGADSRNDSRMVRKDSAADAEEIEHFKAENGDTYKIEADSVLAHIQSHADRAASAWGKSAKHPWDGESIVAYRRRSAREHQTHSPAWKDVDLSTLSGQALRNATAQIFADSIAASSAPDSYGETLREVRSRDDAGHLVKTYYGEPRAWMAQFAGGSPRLAKFILDQRDR